MNKLGTVPLMLAASEDVKARYLTPIARGEAMFSWSARCPSRRPVRTRRRMKTRAVRADSGYVLNGAKRWITNAGVSKYYTVMAVTDPSAGANGISAFVLEDGGPRVSRSGGAQHKLGIKGSPTRELYFDDCAIPADRLIGAEGAGVQDRPAHAGPHPHHDRGAGAGHRAGGARLRPRLCQGAQAVRPRGSPTSRPCSS